MERLRGGPVKKFIVLLATGALGCGSVLLVSAQSGASRLTPLEELGKRLFFDKTLSSPAGQDCAACHGPSVGFTGSDESVNKTGGVYEGAVKGRFGNRKPPAAAYAGARGLG